MSRGVLRHGVRCVAVLLGVSPWSAFALEPTRAITQYGHDVWTRQMGLGDAVYQIVRPRGDYLWLRTSKGLVRFDGVRFVEPLLGEPCMDEPVLAIGTTAEGGLFVRGTTKTCTLREGRLRRMPPTAAIPEGVARVGLLARDGRFWIGADDFIFRSEGDRLVTLRAGTGWISAVIEDRQRAVWAAGSGALYRFDERGETVLRGPAVSSGVVSLLEGRDGRLWVGTVRGVHQVLDGQLVPVPSARSLEDRMITALLEDRDGNVWLGTRQVGLYRLSRGRLAAFTLRDGLLDAEILSLAEDEEGSVWVGTRGGLERFRDTPFTPVTTQEGLAGDDVATVVVARDGTVHAFSQGSGLSHLAGGAVRTYDTRDGLPSLFGGVLHAARNGDVWAGTLGGLSCLSAGRVRTFSRPPLGRGFISAIGEDDEGLIVATHDPAVWRFRGGTLRPLTIRGRAASLPVSGNYVFTIQRGPAGSLWFGTVRGLFRVSPLPEDDGRVPAIDFPVVAVADDGQGSVWMGARAKGLTRLGLADGRITRYTAEQGLFDHEITSVVADDEGRLWMNCPRGLWSASRQELVDFAEGRRSSVRAVAHGIPDGMKTTDCADHQPGAAKDLDGRLWFSTRRGLVVVDPARLGESGRFPPVRLEEVLADRRLVEPKEHTLSLAAGTEDLELHYSALSLLIPERIRFRYQLEGYDRGWVAAGARRVAFYTKLPPGAYRFRVAAASSEGVWSPAVSLAVTLAPHFYETRLWYAFLVLLAAGAIFAVHRLRVRRLRLRHQELMREVQAAIASVKMLRGLLPICASCKRIRSDQGYWEQIEAYVRDHSEARFTHGLCPDCLRTLYPEYAGKVLGPAPVPPREET